MAISEGYETPGAAFRRKVEAQYVLAEKDVPPLDAACHTMNEIALLEGVLANSGPMTLGSSGQPVCHPALSALRQHRLTLERLLVLLALPELDGSAVPSYRSRAGTRAITARWAGHVKGA